MLIFVIILLFANLINAKIGYLNYQESYLRILGCISKGFSKQS